MPEHTIIVIGASAGGVSALIKLVQTLQPDLPAAIFVVLHVPADSTSHLPEILNNAGLLPALHPTDGMHIEMSHIYVAPPDHHMLLEGKHIRIIRGPREKRHRPAIDPLFRSAALEYGPHFPALNAD
jgi:two-component system, chemotaxis family, protein-glutamate methylesterase/glutaminase